VNATPQPAAAARRRRWPFVLVALAVGLLLAAAGGELAARALWQMPAAFAEFDQQGLYRQRADGSIGLVPGYRGTLTVAGRRTEVVVNELGLRGPEVGAKTAGERRLLVAGDSVVFGYGTAAAEALPAQLGAALAARQRPTTVGNAGVPGFGCRDAAAALGHVVPSFGADGVVFASFLGNDALDDLRTEQVVCAGLRFDGPMAGLVRSSWRMRLALHARAALWFETWVFTNRPAWSPLLQQVPTAAELAAVVGLPGDYPVFAPARGGLFLDAPDAHEFAPGRGPVLPRLAANVTAALQVARRAVPQGRLWFLVLPSRAHVDESLRQERLRALGFPPEQFERGMAQRRWLAAAAAAGVPAVDATPWLEEGPSAQWFVDEGHLSAAGAARTAERLAEWLLLQGY
jgi:lysophospholipase L1-like esterase